MKKSCPRKRGVLRAAYLGIRVQIKELFIMENNNTETKLAQNISRLVGVSTLRRIRRIVDGYEKQDKKNKLIATILIIVLLSLFSILMYHVINREPGINVLQTNPNKSLKSDAG
jgi:hypothetical protein